MDDKTLIRGAGQLEPTDDKIGGEPKVSTPKPARRKREGARDSGVGNALRSVYTETVNEQIPDEFLDLLSKLD
ncbi:NepR family anti-sigma factor [Sphingomonas montanisoli]|uniref:Anti-sigma factor NepR domain-containing protein n=1 Tax=Sphingomonas montanisoli TaxID=2606412 RepID=A0A5D9CC85_9SPHN|nr:NepR family anti-sigma factor [Sphingomonas montanisoli]TZG27741.1 hypothetical protein FYJ91_09240 [Sphingomonas montanisoli]